MTAYQVKGSWKGKEVWELPWRNNDNDRAGTFYDMVYTRGK
jgi:hypothetical protein